MWSADAVRDSSRWLYPALFLLLVVCFAGQNSAMAEDVVVAGANPNTADQGTIDLEVEITGSGFKKGAVTRFMVNGTEDPGGVTVKSTKVKGGGKITARIDVAQDATVGDFDIEVENNDGRRGKGVELFDVKNAKGLTGSIYFEVMARTWRMDPDGNDKTELPPGVAGRPSEALHGGARWFLQVTEVVGETHPDCTWLRELWAVRDDGLLSVPLVQGPYMKVGYGLWGAEDSTRDGRVSFTAVRWEEGVTWTCDNPPTAPPELPVPPVEAGIYSAGIDFAGAGDVTGLTELPWLAVELPWDYRANDTYGCLVDGLWGFSWSPDGSELVYAFDSMLWINSFDPPETRQLTNSGVDPDWSPDGEWIAFRDSLGERSYQIFKIRPDGSDLSEIVSVSFRRGSKQLASPRWAPESSHLIYEYRGWPPKGTQDFFSEVYRISADTGAKTNLTADVEDRASVVDWSSDDEVLSE